MVNQMKVTLLLCRLNPKSMIDLLEANNHNTGEGNLLSVREDTPCCKYNNTYPIEVLLSNSAHMRAQEYLLSKLPVLT